MTSGSREISTPSDGEERGLTSAGTTSSRISRQPRPAPGRRLPMPPRTQTSRREEILVELREAM